MERSFGLASLRDVFRKAESADTSDEAAGYLFYSMGAEKAREEKWADALNLFNRALTLQRKSLGKDHVVCGRTLNDIGMALTHLNEPYGAMTSLEEALWIRQHVLGDGHPDVVETLNHLAYLLDRQKNEEDECDRRSSSRTEHRNEGKTPHEGTVPPPKEYLPPARQKPQQSARSA